MTNSSELKAECVRRGFTLEKLASCIGVNISTLHRKIKGETEFNREELQQIRNDLDLSDDLFLKIFFAQ